MKAYRGLGQYRPEVAPFRSWLLAIVANEARNHRRAQGRRHHYELALVPDGAAPAVRQVSGMEGGTATGSGGPPGRPGAVPATGTGTGQSTGAGPAKDPGTDVGGRRPFVSSRSQAPAAPEDIAEAAEARKGLLDAVRSLPPRQRDVVACRYLLELSEAETASVLELSPGTVKSHLSRALARLRREMSSDG